MWDGVWASGLTVGTVAFAVETEMWKGTRSLCKFCWYLRRTSFRRWDSIGGIITGLQAGWSGVWFVAGARDFSFLQNAPSSSDSNSLINMEDSFPRSKVTMSWGWWLYVVQELRMSEDVPLQPLYAYIDV